MGVLFVFSLLGNALSNTFQYTKSATSVTAEASYMPPLSPIMPQVTTSTSEACSCVSYVRSKISSFPRGDAINLETNSIFPIKGGAIKLSYRQADERNLYLYHVAYIHEISTDGKILISSDCKHRKHEIIYEWLDINDERIQGYWSPRI